MASDCIWVVCGGGGYIGKFVVAQILEKAGEIVVVGTSQTYNSIGNETYYAVNDTTSYQAIAEHVGGRKIRLLNLAGKNKNKLLHLDDAGTLESIFEANFFTSVKLTQVLLPAMIDRNFGRIVNFGSVWGSVVGRSRYSYVSSKAALIQFTKAIALDYARFNILANVISPGFIESPMTAIALGANFEQRVGRAVPTGSLVFLDEIWRTIELLTSEANRNLTGQNIILDGGFSINHEI